MSFQIAIAPNRKAAARFVGRVRRRLQKAFVDNPDIKRSDVARFLDVNRSVITRQLSGHQDLSLGRVAEIAWALGYEPEFNLRRREPMEGDNKQQPVQIANIEQSFTPTPPSTTTATIVKAITEGFQPA